MSNEIVLHASNPEEKSSRALALANPCEIATSQQSNQLVEKLRNEREEHRHKQIWIKDPHGGPYRKAKPGNGYDPLTQNPDGTSKDLELGYHFPVETGPTSNFVGNHMTQGAIDLVQSELGQKSAKTLRLRAAAQALHNQNITQPLSLPATNRTNPPKLLLHEHEMTEMKVVDSTLDDGIAPILAVQGGRPPDLSELRKTVRRQRKEQMVK
ncbi:hypothetical protein NADE_004721 [Nannochloris sp. 'desiccata']|nr:hypothetical protein NADE_004721 [Chlorella desiccata (nom. nud.)]